jgi:flagellar FliL protein
MKEGSDQNAGTAPAAAPKKSSLLKWIVLVVVFLLMGGAGVGAYFYWRTRNAPPEAAEKQEEHAAEPGGVLTLEPFVVNLADTDGSRFLRVHLRLVIADGSNAKELEEEEVRMLRVRSVVLELLSTQLASHLVTPAGKSEVKKAIADQASKILGVKVTDVLFSEFVVQF